MSTRHLWLGARLCGHSTALWLRPWQQQVFLAAMSSSKGGRRPADLNLRVPQIAANKSRRKSKRTAATKSGDSPKDQSPPGRKIRRRIRRTTLELCPITPPRRCFVTWPNVGFLLPIQSHLGGVAANFSKYSEGGEEVPPPFDTPPTAPRRGSIARGFPVTPGIQAEAAPPQRPRFAPSGLPSMPSIEPEILVETPTESSEEIPSESSANPEAEESTESTEEAQTQSRDSPTFADPPTDPPEGFEGEISQELRIAVEELVEEGGAPEAESPGKASETTEAPPLPPSKPSSGPSTSPPVAPKTTPAAGTTPAASEPSKVPPPMAPTTPGAERASPTVPTPIVVPPKAPPLAGGGEASDVKPPKGTRAYTAPPKKPTGPFGPPEPTPKGPLFPPKTRQAPPADKPTASKKEPPPCTPANKTPTGKDKSPPAPAPAAASAAPKKEVRAAGAPQPPSKPPPPTGGPGKPPGLGTPKKPTAIAPTGSGKEGSKNGGGHAGSGKNGGTGGTKGTPPSSGKGSSGPRLITLMPGDGIGPEISMAVLEVLDALKAPLIFEPVDVTPVIDSKGQTRIPDEVIESMNRTKVGLKGPLMTPVGTGFRSLNLTLRQLFNLYANVRPCKSLPGVETVYGDVDVVTIRENTEGEYSGLEHTLVNGVVQSIKLITRDASMRVADYCFKYAIAMKRKKITAVHEVNNMRMSDGLFIRCMRETAKKYEKELSAGGVKYEEMTLKTTCLKIVEDPKTFDVLILPNLYGDIISDTCAGLIGGLGLTPSGNIGTSGAIFESVHGTAPDIAGKDLANPTALLLSTVMLLHYVDLHTYADAIEKAIVKTIKEDNVRTIDLGGKAKCSEYTKALIKNLK